MRLYTKKITCYELFFSIIGLCCILLAECQEKTTHLDTQTKQQAPIPKICDGNRFQYISSFVLGRQNDLTQTFQKIQESLNVKNVSYSDKIGRMYKIYNFKTHILYLESKQVPEVKGINVLNISGGYVRITYNFEWEKEQLGSSIKGNGSGLVSSNPVSFQKTLQTNDNHELQWVLSKTLSIGISNSLTLSTVTPYKQLDYQILNQMLNKLKNNATTVKTQLIQALNVNFSKILKQIVKNDETITIPKQIQYSYIDYRGQFDVLYDNILLENALTKNGLSLLLSQTIQNDKSFECGQKVPDQPEAEAKYGGTQQFISNKFLKSTLKYALVNHNIDVTLTQQNWQSRAFQFFMGDLHDAIDYSKTQASMRELSGTCSAIDDKTFSLQTKDSQSYKVTVNFTCQILEGKTKIVDLILPVQYQIKPQLLSKQLRFLISSIDTKPTYIEASKYKITNRNLADFMLKETLSTAISNTVIGSGYKTRNRKNPAYEVRDGYLFLFDRTTINHNVVYIE